MPTEEGKGKEESQGRYLYVLTETTMKGTYNFEYVPFIVRAFGLLFDLEHVVSIQCFVNQF